jgi:hypothetical protein
MVSIEEIQAAYYMVAATGVLVAAAYYVLNMKNAEKLRRTQVVMTWFSLLQNRDYHRHFVDLLYKYNYTSFQEWEQKYRGDKDPDANSCIFAMMNQLDYVGFMYHERIADPESIYRIVPPSWIKLAWLKISPIIKGMREASNDSKLGELAEYLFNETVKRFPGVGLVPERAKIILGVEK